VGTVDVPLRELAGRGEVRLKGRSVLALRLATVLAEGRQPGSYAGMTPVSPAAPGGGVPVRPTLDPPAHAATPLP
jgi:hypothetical protein